MGASEQIDEMIAGLNDWRGLVFAKVRKVIRAAYPGITETVKWRGAPVWSLQGDLCLAMPFKNKVKLTFPQGAFLPDPSKLFNSELDGKQWRAIDLFENDKIKEKELKGLVREAVNYNRKKQALKAARK